MIKWKNVYSIGDNTIDEQHQTLISFVNDLDEKISSLKREEIFVILDKLEKYAKTHFAYEEEFMRKADYPQIIIDEHIKEHSSFLSIINSALVKSKDLTFAFMINVTIAIKEWIISHILGTDKEFELFMRTKDDSSKKG